MTTAAPNVRRVRTMKVAGLGTLIGAGVLLSACFGPGTIAAGAGNGTAGYAGDGGAATSANLTSPRGVVADSSGNLYIADTGNCVIRKVTASTGKISTIAGTGGSCGLSGDGAAATSAQLNHPIGVALNGDKLYIGDSDNNRIRLLTISTGVITTFAGSTAGAVNGNRTSTAKFTHPEGLALDSAGNVFVADTGNHAIREVNVTTNNVSTVAGVLGVSGDDGDFGAATSAHLASPEAIAIDPYDELFIADTGNCQIRWVDTGGSLNPMAGTTCGFSGDGGDPSLAKLGHAAGIAVDSDVNVYVADTGNNRVRKISSSTGLITTIAGTGTAGGTGDDGSATAATLSGPTGLWAVSYDRLWVADTGNNRVRMIGLDPAPTTTTTPASTSSTTTSTTVAG